MLINLNFEQKKTKKTLYLMIVNRYPIFLKYLYITYIPMRHTHTHTQNTFLNKNTNFYIKKTKTNTRKKKKRNLRQFLIFFIKVFNFSIL